MAYSWHYGEIPKSKHSNIRLLQQNYYFSHILHFFVKPNNVINFFHIANVTVKYDTSGYKRLFIHID